MSYCCVWWALRLLKFCANKGVLYGPSVSVHNVIFVDVSHAMAMENLEISGNIKTVCGFHFILMVLLTHSVDHRLGLEYT